MNRRTLACTRGAAAPQRTDPRPRKVQKHKSKSVDTFSLRVFGEITPSLEVTFQSRSQHWQRFAACLGGFKSAGFNGCAESARIRRPQVIATQPHQFLITPLRDSSS